MRTRRFRSRSLTCSQALFIGKIVRRSLSQAFPNALKNIVGGQRSGQRAMSIKLPGLLEIPALVYLLLRRLLPWSGGSVPTSHTALNLVRSLRSPDHRTLTLMGNYTETHYTPTHLMCDA